MRSELLPFFAAALLLYSMSTTLAVEPAQVQVPRLTMGIGTEKNEAYAHELLTLALKKSGVPYRITSFPIKMQQARSIAEMINKDGNIDVLWSMSTDLRESQMIAIKIPIDKGLIGWRIPLVTKENANLFANVKTLRQLMNFKAGQEFDWPDVSILRLNGVATITSSSYQSLFDMLRAGRFDYFPRSMFEIWHEVDAHPRHELHVDKHIVLHYPAANYFFVSTRRPKLAKDLRVGLKTAIKDGSFEKLFQAHHLALITRARIKNRTVIEMGNPLFHPETADQAPAFWFDPASK